MIQEVHSSEEVSTDSRRTSNPSSLYCPIISDRRGSSVVNRFSQPSFFSSSSRVTLGTFSPSPRPSPLKGEGEMRNLLFSVLLLWSPCGTLAPSQSLSIRQAGGYQLGENTPKPECEKFNPYFEPQDLKFRVGLPLSLCHLNFPSSRSY